MVPFQMRRTLCSMLLALVGMTCLAADAAPVSAGAQQDTLNRMDPMGRKDGWWRVLAPREDRPDYADGQLIEEGRYAGGRRVGVWRRYWPNGKLMSEITYVAGRPRGAYTTYYPDGRPEEQGQWDLDRNTGGFKRWHPNGELAQDFVFNAYGIRDGVQRYYHENGRLEVEVTVKEGREEGTLKRYYPSGELQQVAVFVDGKIDEARSRYMKPAKPVAEAPAPDAAPAPERRTDEVTNAVLFRGNGFNTLYDKQLRITQQGEFKDGRLWDGRYYRYSDQGELYRIEVYERGRYAGNAVITDEDKAR